MRGFIPGFDQIQHLVQVLPCFLLLLSDFFQVKNLSAVTDNNNDIDAVLPIIQEPPSSQPPNRPPTTHRCTYCNQQGNNNQTCPLITQEGTIGEKKTEMYRYALTSLCFRFSYSHNSIATSS
jgi:hypothetical protein